MNTELAKYPKNSVFIYARPWQMLASGHTSFSESSFKSWSTEQFAEWMQKSEGNIYLVRGQDGYGKVNRASRVVGFKTTDQIDDILGNFKNERVLMNARDFGYGLAIYKILSKKGVSQYAQNFMVTEESNGMIVVNKRFPESIACDYKVNDKDQGEMLVSNNADTLLLDSAKIRVGMNRVVLSCSMPDEDTLVTYRDFFVDGENVALLSKLKMGKFFQEWGEPQMNETVEHHKITIDGEPFRYGIGSHANSSIEFPLSRGYDWLNVVVGLDDESACGDGAFFVVEADGREIYHSKKLYTTDKERLKLDIKGAKSINLRVLMGKDKDCDHGDWAHAWLEAEK